MKLIIVYYEGWFDLSDSLIQCTQCLHKTEVTVELYLQSSFCPDLTTSLIYLYSEDVLEYLIHLEH
jgi:hypothetical protein